MPGPGFKKGNTHGKAPKAGKGVGRKKSEVTEAKRAAMEARLPQALKVIDAKLAEGDGDIARWVVEHNWGKAVQQKQTESEITVRVLADGEEE